MAQETIPILSFFCGAGGLDYGFTREDFRVVLGCDTFSAAVRSYNFNAKRRVAQEIDLATVEPDELCATISDLSPDCPPEGVIGGPPCQGFSRGNAQADPRDPRNRLPFRFAALLGALNERFKLKFFVFENVMGLANPKHRPRFKSIQAAFRRAGFNVFSHDLDAQDFGVPQLRRRLFIVGLNRELFPGVKFVFPAGHVKKVTVRDAIANLPKATLFERGLTATDIAYHPNHWTMQPRSTKFGGSRSTDGRSFRRLEWDEVSPTVAYGNREIHVHPDGERRLTVHEAMLLQGFPSTYRPVVSVIP